MSSAPESRGRRHRRPGPIDRVVAWVDRAPLARWIFLLGLFFTVFAGNSRLLGLPLGPERLLIPLAVLLIALDPRRPTIRWRPVHAAIAFLVFWTLLSMVSHGTLGISDARFAFLDRVLLPLVLFVCAPLFFPDEHARREFARALTVLGAWLALNTIFEMVGPKALVLPRYVLAAADPEATATRRAMGPFLASEALGMVLLLAGFAGMLTAARDRGGWRRFGAVVAPLCFLSSILTMTRSVWLGAVVAVLVAVAASGRMRRSALGVVAAVVAGAAIATATLPEMVEDFFTRLSMSSSLYDRANTNAAALRILAERPLEGIGWGRFILDGAQWVRQSPDYPLTNVGIEVHNVFLSRAAELGVPGAVAFLVCLLAGPVWILVRTRRTEAPEWWAFGIAALAIWLVPSLSSPNPYPLPNDLFWVISGMLGVGLFTWPRESDPARLEPASPSPEPSGAHAAVGASRTSDPSGPVLPREDLSLSGSRWARRSGGRSPAGVPTGTP